MATNPVEDTSPAAVLSTRTDHPLDPIRPSEISSAVRILRQNLSAYRVRFKFIDLVECRKADVVPYLVAERNGNKLPQPPNRRARIYFHTPSSRSLQKAIVDLTSNVVVSIEHFPDAQGPVDYDEFEAIERLCNTHPEIVKEVNKMKLPPGARIVNDPWAYGTDDTAERRRLFQCYVYIVLDDDPEANHYSLPAPFSPVFDATSMELQWIDYLPIGPEKEADHDVQPWDPVPVVEYSARVLGEDYFRKDLKPLQVIQPQGPSFHVDGRQVSWQKWKFTLGWTLREGPVLQNMTFDGRSTFYRVSLSEMTVPYGDPRSPYHRKQAFDLGDSGLGLTSNQLTLGCDCLGHIKYFDGARVTADGQVVEMKNVVCMHEVDAGVGWKHTNFRSGAASVVRNRQLVIQCTATVANYEYIMAFILDQAANLHLEVRATGIVSTMPIAKGVKVPWGTTVAPGVLAVNHQHMFNMRVDPAIDGYRNTVVCTDIVPELDDPALDPFGVAFKAEETRITKPGGYHLNTDTARVYQIQNPSVVNTTSGKPVSYKLHAIPSQMMIMKANTFSHKRGVFASKPIWVTQYRDDELWAAGEFTNQSRCDTGLGTWASRDESVEDEDVVLWHTFGLTHVTRPEDFPVMPVEIMSVALKPSNFFTLNPSNDVPRSGQAENQSVEMTDIESMAGGVGKGSCASRCGSRL